MPPTSAAVHRWLRTGDEFFSAMFAAIESAHQSVRLETYIYGDDPLGQRFRDALVAARQRGAQVRVLIDALGSNTLATAFWDPLIDAGGEFRWFNPLSLNRLSIRNHRKLLVADEQVAFVGGHNLAREYLGDGVTSGWNDLGLQLNGPLASELAVTFDQMFRLADFRHFRFARLRKTAAKKSVAAPQGELLLSGPGRGRNPLKRALRRDLGKAGAVQIIAAYFLPTWRIRRQLMRLARRGRRVQLILPAKTDVALSQLATRSLYHRLLRAGIEIHEYQPQILHAKLVIIDGVVYAGSSNLDTRSLSINYELQVRLPAASLAGEAREIFSQTLRHCEKVDLATWRKQRTWWSKLKERWAYFVLVHVDTWVARRQYKTLRQTSDSRCATDKRSKSTPL